MRACMHASVDSHGYLIVSMGHQFQDPHIYPNLEMLKSTNRATVLAWTLCTPSVS